MARDLIGNKNKAKLSAAAQAQLDRMQQAMQQRGYSYQSGAESPFKILFIAKVPEEVKQNAIASAFKKAVKEVEMLAASTNQKRGKLLSVTTEGTSTGDDRLLQGFYAQTQDLTGSVLEKFNLGTDFVSSPNADDLKLLIDRSAARDSAHWQLRGVHSSAALVPDCATRFHHCLDAE